MVATPLARRLSVVAGAIDVPGPRRVHTHPTPRLGGLAIYAGVLAALGAGALLAEFSPVWATSEPLAVLLAASIVVVLGVVDDTRGLPAFVKLAGQVLAAGVLTLFGILLRFVYIPGEPGTLVFLTPELSAIVTIVAIVVMINAVNLTDGLDGLAAGMVAIAAAAMLAWTLLAEVTRLDTPSIAALLLSAVLGSTLGFLVYNRPPASVFMGDTGAMLLGLLLGAAGISALGPLLAPSRSAFAAASVPVLVPALVLAVPLLDTIWAVLRRLGSPEGLLHPDKRHLHHRLLAIGHSVRGAVAIMYYCSALLAFGAVAVSLLPVSVVAAILAVGAMPVAFVLVRPRRGEGDPTPGEGAADR